MTVMFVLNARSWPHTTKSQLVPVPVTNYNTEEYQIIVKNFFEVRKEWTTSNLGTYLFKHGIKLDNIAWNKSLHGVFNVLIWEHWEWLKRRHIGGFIEHDNNPLYGCSVSNCQFSGDTNISSADAVVIHIQKGLIPKVASRNLHQLWIFWVDESPRNTFSLSKKPPSFKELSNIFNWSMTYRF
ncbi:uncharacterized protein LOC134744057 [Cydia strobilella]|uniref:uncharacterized protein LOC134744057 n=1 Tax=Cydia strobilella TaxID=1100964 RepID=UPI003006204D